MESNYTHFMAIGFWITIGIFQGLAVVVVLYYTIGKLVDAVFYRSYGVGNESTGLSNLLNPTRSTKVTSPNLMLQANSLYSNLALLARGVHTGIKPTLIYQSARVWEVAKELAGEPTDRKSWRNYADGVEVFIDPEALHAFVKLQSHCSALVAASFLNNKVEKQGQLAAIATYLEKICAIYGVTDTKSIIT